MIEQRTIGRTFDAEIVVHEVCKYTGELKKLENSKRVIVRGIESWDIVTGDEAKEIEAHTDGSCIDDMHEYLVLHLEGGETSTFRNSYVDMFRV